MQNRDMSFGGGRFPRVAGMIVLCILIMCVLVLESCKKRNPEKAPQGFISFNQFMSDVRSAKQDDYVGKQGHQVESTTAFEEMKQHILKMYEGITPTHSFLENHQMVDCVPLDQQPGLRRPGGGREELRRESPPVTSVPQQQKIDGVKRTVKMADLTLKPGVKDSHGEDMYCAEGTIPNAAADPRGNDKVQESQKLFCQRKRVGRLRSASASGPAQGRNPARRLDALLCTRCAVCR